MLSTNEIISAISAIIALFALLYGIHVQKTNKKLQIRIFEYEKEKNRQEKQKEMKFEAYKNHQFENEPKIYFDYIRSQFEYLDFTGLNAILQKPIKLENIYVRLKVVDSYNQKRSDKSESNPIEVGSKGFMDSLKEYFENIYKVRDTVRILIVGHPGSGKTTLMKWLALQCLKTENEFLYSYIPIYIPLKNFGKDPYGTFRRFNIQDITKRLFEHYAISSTFLKKVFNEQKVLFLLDGLDEVADEAIRLEIIEWIQRQNLLRSLLIITSRYSGIQASKGITFKSTVPMYEIQNFSKDEVAEFLKNWYQNVELSITDYTNVPETLNKAQRSSLDLVQIIDSPEHSSLASLAVNPLLLTIIAIVHRTRAVLPKERHRLYEEAVKVMIELWNLANRKIELSFSIDNSISHLSSIAVYLMKNKTKELTETDLRSILPKNIEGKDVGLFLEEMILKSGLLYASEGKYGFLHLTFQEYLAARYFAKSEDQNEIINYINEDFWNETLKLFINIGNAHLFFDELLRQIKDGKVHDMNFALELSLEIVFEEDRNKYVNQVLNLLLPGLLSLQDNAQDNKKLQDIYFPATHLYLKNTEELHPLFWELLQKGKSTAAKIFATIILYNAQGVIRNNVVNHIRIELNSRTSRYTINYLRVRRSGPHDSDSQNEDIETLQREEVNYAYFAFHVLSILSTNCREKHDAEFLVDALKSEFDLLQYIAIIILRNFDHVKPFAKKLNVNQLAITKSLKSEDYLVEARPEQIEAVPGMDVPASLDDMKSGQYTYWSEMRPFWQIEQLHKSFYQTRESFKTSQKKIAAVGNDLLKKIEHEFETSRTKP